MLAMKNNTSNPLKQIAIIVATSVITLFVAGYFSDDKEVALKTAASDSQGSVAKSAADEMLEASGDLEGQIANLQAELYTANQQIQDLEGKLAVTDGELTKLGDEFLISYGTVEDLGLQMGSLVKKYIESMKRFKALKDEGRSWRDMSEEERNEGRMRMMGIFGEWTQLSPTFSELKSLGETPEDAAKLQTVFLSEVFGLNEASSNAVGGIFDTAYLSASESGLAQSQMPDKDVEAWNERRTEMSEEVSVSLSEHFSSEQMDIISAIGNGNLLNMPDLSLQNKAIMNSLGGGWRR